MNLKNYFTDSKYTDYAVLLKAQGLSSASIKRKLSSISSFEKFLIKKNLIEPQIVETFHETSLQNKADLPFVKGRNPDERRGEGFRFLNKYTLLATLFIIFSALGWGLYNQTILKARKNLAYSTIASPVHPSRILSFQGRLTDSATNPISSSTSILFDLYTVIKVDPLLLIISPGCTSLNSS